MRQIAALIACLAATVCRAESPNDSLQGVWFGTQHAQRIVLVVRDDKMLFIHPTGAKESAFRLSADGIDIDRYDGKKQLGLFRSDETTLTLTLADPGETVRPESLGVNNGRARQGTVIFTRKVTSTGLRTLQANLSNNPKLDLTAIGK